MWKEKHWYGILTLTFFLTKQQTLWLRIAISSCDLESILNLIRPKRRTTDICLWLKLQWCLQIFKVTLR